MNHYQHTDGDNFGLRKIKLKPEYNTDDDNIIRDFYRPCLQNAICYDRAVGYFRANIYRELGEDLLNYVIRGGKVRIVCSPDISEQDELAAREGYSLRGHRTPNELQADLMRILQVMSKNPKDADCLEMLRLLIEKEALELYIAVRPGGIYHRKIGMFSDSYGNKVVFFGSGNETAWAIGSIEDWVNDEEFDVYRSWGSEFESYKAKIKERHLQKLFSGGTRRTIVRPLNEFERAFLNKFRSFKNYEDCRPGARERTALFEKQEKSSDIIPYSYQKDAINAWKKAGMIGILSMATGTGKTYTALFAIKELLKEGRPILIVVPTTILLSQWRGNIASIYPDVPVLLAGDNYNWKSQTNKRMFISELELPRIILATMATASSNDFIEFFRQAKDPILIADEVHRLGSPIYRKILNVDFYAKLGLSATPERLFDKEGSKILHKSFGEKPVYDLPINSKVKLSDNNVKTVPILGYFLSRYDYYFYIINLTENEQKEWNCLTEEIRKMYAYSLSIKDDDKKNKINQKIKILLIRRSKIIKKAKNKVNIINQIIEDKYPSNGKWIVYCEDEVQLNQVINELKRKHKHKVILKYHSKMKRKDREISLEYFESNPSIIVSIRCLDEGVDVPKANGAIILASSSNPRQYIQRRGRVLRKSINKKQATIIDVLVLPKGSENGVPYSIIKGELARAWNFAQNAMNKDVAHKLWKICVDYDVDIKLDSISGIENEGSEK